MMPTWTSPSACHGPTEAQATSPSSTASSTFSIVLLSSSSGKLIGYWPPEECCGSPYRRLNRSLPVISLTLDGAMHAIIYAHGHEMVWNAQLMRDTLYFAGFDDVRSCPPGQSDDPILRGVEGHGAVIGDKFNLIESCTHEARKGPWKASELPASTLPEATDQRYPEVAVILGGAEGWQQDLEEAKRLLNGQKIQYFMVNDQIKTFPEPGIACTLHPDKLNGHFAWLRVRSKAGLPEPIEIWAHRKHGAVTHDTASIDWGGSSGLLAVQVALRKKFRKIIGCGVPMTTEGKHFERHQKWQSAIAFRSGWTRYRKEFEPYFRSMSGWTAEQFGKPDEEWLKS